MYKQREVTLKRYGRYIRVINAPKPERNTTETTKGGKREADLDTPKSRSNFGTSAHKALSIALNNQWHWYGHLHISKEDVTDFDAVYKAIQTITDRLRKQRERKEKNLSYLIIPDFNEQNNVKKWFLHIWLMNVPEADKAFSKDIVSEKKITYHWKKYEKQNGISELYKIYSSGYTTNNRWQEQNAFQIFDIMKRTASVVPKNKSLFYSSNNVVGDIIIARGRPSEIHQLSKSPNGNNFVYSEWFTAADIQENIDEGMKYLLSSDIVEAWVEELTEEDLKSPDEPERQKETFCSYDSCSYEGKYIPSADDNYYCTEPPEDFDYNELNEIYENEVYNFD